jgi:hypothetical protein
MGMGLRLEEALLAATAATTLVYEIAPRGERRVGQALAFLNVRTTSIVYSRLGQSTVFLTWRGEHVDEDGVLQSRRLMLDATRHHPAIAGADFADLFPELEAAPA